MRSLLIVFALGVAVSATPYKFDHDIKINVYDVFKSLYGAAPLSTYLDHLRKDGFFSFLTTDFHFYPEEKIHDVLVAYRVKGENYLHGYLLRAEDVSKYDDKFFDAVRPVYDYLNSGEYYAFTPYAAKKVAPEYFNFPLKEIFYKYYTDIDVSREIPVVFLVPKTEVNQAEVDDLILIAEYEVTKNGNHVIHEHFEPIENKTVARRDLYYTSPEYRTGYPYPYDTAYYYNSYFRGYPYLGYPGYHILKKRADCIFGLPC